MILYATKYGSVREYATRIAEAAHGDGVSDGVHLIDAAARRGDARRALAERPAEPVLIVAPIYAGRLHRAMARLVEEARNELEARPVALALACLYQGEEAEKQLVAAFPAWLVAHASLRVVVGGRIRISELKPIVRIFFRRALKLDRDIDQYEDRWVAELAAWLRQAGG